MLKKDNGNNILWLRLLKNSEYLETEKAEPLLEEAKEIQRIITAILKTSKGK